MLTSLLPNLLSFFQVVSPQVTTGAESSVISRYVSSEVLVGMLLVLMAIGVAFGALAAMFVAIKYKERREKGLKGVLLELRIPQENEHEVNVAEQMFANLHGIGKKAFLDKYLSVQDTISFEIVGMPESIRFYIFCPKRFKELVEKQVHGSYPDADVFEVDQYNIFQEDAYVSYTSLKLKKDSYYPLRSYEDLSADTMSSLTSALGKLSEGEGAAIQITISPAKSSWSKAGMKYVGKIEAHNADPEKKKLSVPQETLDAVKKKCSKLGFYTAIRVVASAKHEEVADAHLKNIVSTFDQFNNPGINDLGKGKAGRLKKRALMNDFLYRYLPMRNNQVLNVEELASLFHLPNKDVQTPHINWLSSKRAPADARIPTSGLWLGKTAFRGMVRDVFIKNDDRRRHIYVIGKTGSGKSYSLQSMVMQDIYEGRGVAFLDPHGDAIDWCLERIPPERVEDVIYFNPADTERPVGFNMMEYYSENDKHMIVNAFVGMLYKMFDPNQQGIVGPRLERAVRNAMLTAMAEQGNTLIEVMRLITDPEFVKKKLPLVKDDLVRRYWTDEIAKTSEFHKSEVLGYIVSKFDRFVTNKIMRNIIGQSKSSFDFRNVMDEKKILMVNLSKGLIGEENSSFLGLILVPRFLRAAMSRADVDVEQREDFYLYVDEFQNFATEEFAQILSEARKYRLNLTVGNQYIAQVDEKIRDAVFGNVGTLISFKVGVNDASYLEHEFAPVFNEKDLVNIDNQNAYVKLLVDGEYPPPFSIVTTYDPVKDFPVYPEVAGMVKQLSRLRFGRDRNIVEDEIRRRADLAA